MPSVAWPEVQAASMSRPIAHKVFRGGLDQGVSGAPLGFGRIQAVNFPLFSLLTVRMSIVCVYIPNTSHFLLFTMV